MSNMDWKQILSLSFEDLTDLKRDEIYDNMIVVKRENIDKKHYKKFIDMQQHILKYKGDMVVTLLSELEMISSRELPGLGNDVLLDENNQLKDLLTQLESEKTKLKLRVKDLNEEHALLQKKFEASTFGSDREDSPDVLSELDKHEDLLNNISQKNKHIKRLLRDIETLERQAETQVLQVKSLQQNLNEATSSLNLVTNQLVDHKQRIGQQTDVVDELTAKVVDLSDRITAMEQDRQDRELEIHEFGRQLEERAVVWKQMLEDKDERLESLRAKYEDVLDKNPGYNIDSERIELTRMSEAVIERDELITELETKIVDLSREMMRSTDIMNKLAKEREAVSVGPNSLESKGCCCDDLRKMLERSSVRCKELQEIISNVEEDNIHKSKQAMEAAETLASFKSGEDGLAHALKRNTDLQNKINARDKHVRTLIMELNSMQEISQENFILRKRLGLPEDELVSTKSFMAKQRKFEKVNERLTLKLRASEEMRLQLKLEKNDLKRQMDYMVRSDVNLEDTENRSTYDIKFCEQCMDQFNARDAAQLCSSCQQHSNLCGKCKKQLKTETSLNATEYKIQIEEIESRYAIVIDENENLRIGMHEILEQLRNYDAESDHIVIETSTLERLLHALDARSISGWYHPAMRIQNELIASKEREIALKERARISETMLQKTKFIEEIQTETVTSEHHESPVTVVSRAAPEPAPRHEIPSKVNNLNDLLSYIQELELILQKSRTDVQTITDQHRDTILECEKYKIFEKYMSNLTEKLSSEDNEKDALLARHASEMIILQTDLNKQKNRVIFIEEDYRDLKLTSKTDKELNQRLLFALQQQLIDREKQLKVSERQMIKASDVVVLTSDEDLMQELKFLKFKMAKFTEFTLQQMSDDNHLRLEFSQLRKLGVIQDNMTVELVTRDEFENIKNESQNLREQNETLKINAKHTDDLLKLSKQQLTAQQQLLSEQSADEVALRHLIVDLQSESNEKYIIAKTNRELKRTQDNEDLLKTENAKLKAELAALRQDFEDNRTEAKIRNAQLEAIRDSNDLKLKFLTKSFTQLRLNYHTFMPLYPIVDYLQDFSSLQEAKRQIDAAKADLHKVQTDREEIEITQKIKDVLGQNLTEDKITIIKYQTQNAFMQRQMKLSNEQIDELQTEIGHLKLQSANSLQHWNTIEMLFEKDKPMENIKTRIDKFSNKEIQTQTETTDKCINTDEMEDTSGKMKETISKEVISSISPTKIASQPIPPNRSNETLNSQKSMESQLKQAMILASTRSSLLLETENRLALAQGRIKGLERNLEAREKALREELDRTAKTTSPRKDDNILSITIASLQNLLLEKDTTLSRYQDLLRTERQSRSSAFDDHRAEIKTLQKTIEEVEIRIKVRDRELEGLRDKLAEQQKSRMTEDSVARDISPAKSACGSSIEKKIKFNEELTSSQQLPDTFIEDLFLDDRSAFEIDTGETNDLRKRLLSAEEDVRKLQSKLRDVSNRELGWERNLSEKDKEITALNERLNNDQLDINDISDNISTRREIEQLREMLEEKDRHITDLTDTLTHFHDDQQKFINDTSLHSAEQVSQLSADLNRCEATNRILNTQLDALKRQLSNISQREAQAREVIKALKTQLIRRPVISVKAIERPCNAREEQLQKRVHQMENDLLMTKEELRKQTSIVQSRRTKDAADLGLWNKQKRFQQMSDTLKQKLNDRDTELEKLKQHFGTAKTTIARLEREKHMLESRLTRTAGTRFCQGPSCPNLQHNTKYTPAESPDSYTTGSDFHHDHTNAGPHHTPSLSSRSKQLDVSDNNQEIIDALKARIESQQRKIVTMELEGRGGSAMATELEKLQEKISNIEALNIRLEARNLHLQLDNDMLRQGDHGEKTKRQIKHLEDYIIALKAELAQAHVSVASVAEHSSRSNSGSSVNGQQMEQTILAMRRVVERLKVENKNLKDGKMLASKSGTSKEMYDKLRSEFERVQQSFSDSLDKISALQIELEIQNGTCSQCKSRKDKDVMPGMENVDLANELKSLKDKLIKKTQLLEKAKILLSRAAAKEKNFREQVIFWKRRCSELQNVPVIDEASE